MSTATFIANSLALGASRGLDTLSPVERVVFAVSEAEVYCDMEGIDGLFQKYGYASAPVFSEAFRAIGASEIGAAFSAVANESGDAREELLERANDLVRKRDGYQYESIVAYVQRAV